MLNFKPLYWVNQTDKDFIPYEWAYVICIFIASAITILFLTDLILYCNGY